MTNNFGVQSFMEIREKLKELSDQQVFELLDTVSEEVKRRNSLTGPSISEISSNTPEQNLALLINSLSKLNITTRKNKK